jgi:non-ribosomal peptide synthetase-like protein
VVPAGTVIGEGSLIGVLTVPPEDKRFASRKGASWLGSPPIFLARRQPATGRSEQSTFRPTRLRQWARGCFELLRISLPGAGFVIATVGVIDAVLSLWEPIGPAVTLCLFPAIYAFYCAVVILAVVPLKWLVVGRYQPFEKPCWSAFVWRLEFVNALFEFLASPIGLETLEGTPLLPWYLRLMGCRIGKGVYIETTGFLEFDLTEVGDRAMLNKACILQTHLFEDRVMKGSGLKVGADCEIGTDAIVLYDTEMKAGARLGPLSLVMKGEVLPAGRLWIGSPLSSSTETLEVARRDAVPVKSGAVKAG